MKHAPYGDWGHPAPHGKLPPFRFWIQQTLPSLYDDSLSYMELCSRLTWYINQIVNTLKVYDDKFCELMCLYKELEDYVRCYLDHADFPGMVKDVLDDMVATGRLTEIIMSSLPDFSIDPKKIKNGIVPVHYTYTYTENGVEYFKRTECEKKVLNLLSNGSIIVGIFEGSPSVGSFISFMKKATWNIETSDDDCECDNTSTKDFMIHYQDYILDENDFIKAVVITDNYCELTTLELKAVYNDIPDDYVTSAKIKDGEVKTPDLADASVTEPKLAVDSVTTVKIVNGSVTPEKLAENAVGTTGLADGSVTHPKIASYAVGAKNIASRCITPTHINKRSFIFIGDSYGAGYGLSSTVNNWINKVMSACDITGNVFRSDGNFGFSSAVTGSGFVGQSGVKTFLQQLQDVTATLNSLTNIHSDQYNDDDVDIKDYITDIIVCGGWNDQGKSESAINTAMSDFVEYVGRTYPNATVHTGFIAGQDMKKRDDRGDDVSQFTFWETIAKYTRCAGQAGIAYITNSEYILHRWDWFQSDGIHPNEDGQTQIAKYIASYVKGGGVDVVRGFEVVTDDVTLASGVSNYDNDWIVSTWQNNGRCGLWMNQNHWVFSSPVDFSGHPSADTNGVGTKILFTLPENSYVQGGQFSGMQVCLTATYKVDDENEYYTRPTYVRLTGKSVAIIPISTNEGSGSDPYAPLENISDVIFQVGTVRIEGETLFN